MTDRTGDTQVITDIQQVRIPSWAFEQFKRNFALTDLQTFAFLGIVSTPLDLWPLELHEQMAEAAMPSGVGQAWERIATYVKRAIA